MEKIQTRKNGEAQWQVSLSELLSVCACVCAHMHVCECYGCCMSFCPCWLSCYKSWFRLEGAAASLFTAKP